MSETTKEAALLRETRVSEALLKLSKNSTRESQRLQAIKTSWTAKLRASAIRSNWNKSVDKECGADIVLEDLCVPFIPQEKKKTSYRKACFFVAKIGSMVKDSELFTFGKDVTELKIPTKLHFENVAADFELFLDFYGMDLTLKEKLSSVSPTAKFSKWASAKLTKKDLTSRMQTHILEPTDSAPKIPRIYGTVDCCASSRISVFEEIIHEGFVHLWKEQSGTWQMVWASLKNGVFKCQIDPRSKSQVILEVPFTGDLIIKKSDRRRQYALGLKNAKHDVVIACQDGEDMLEWMKSSTKHQQHLYKWDKFADENCELDISGDLEQRPLSPLFTSKYIGGGAEANRKKKRRSRSAEVSNTPKRPSTAMAERRRMSQRSVYSASSGRQPKRSSSIESPRKTALATSMPARPFVTPRFNGLDKPMTFEELDSPITPVQILRIDSDAESDDNTMNDGEELANAYDIGETTDDFIKKVDDTIELVPTDFRIPSPEPVITRATPLRTSTKIVDPNLRFKYQPDSQIAQPTLDESLSPIKISDEQPKSLPVNNFAVPAAPQKKSSGCVVRRVEVPPTDSGPRSLPVLLSNRLDHVARQNRGAPSSSAAKQLQLGKNVYQREKKENLHHNVMDSQQFH